MSARSSVEDENEDNGSSTSNFEICKGSGGNEEVYFVASDHHQHKD